MTVHSVWVKSVSSFLYYTGKDLKEKRPSFSDTGLLCGQSLQVLVYVQEKSEKFCKFLEFFITILCKGQAALQGKQQNSFVNQNTPNSKL